MHLISPLLFWTFREEVFSNPPKHLSLSAAGPSRDGHIRESPILEDSTLGMDEHVLQNLHENPQTVGMRSLE